MPIFKNNFKKFLGLPIQIKLFILLVILIITPFSLGNYLNFLSVEDSHKKEILDRLSDIFVYQMNSLNFFISKTVEEVQSIAESPYVKKYLNTYKNDRDESEIVLHEFLDNFDYAGYAILSTNDIIFSTPKCYKILSENLRELSKTISEVNQKRTTRLSNIINQNNDNYTLFFSPVFIKNNLKGILVIQVKLNIFKEFINNDFGFCKHTDYILNENARNDSISIIYKSDINKNYLSTKELKSLFLDNKIKRNKYLFYNDNFLVWKKYDNIILLSLININNYFQPLVSNRNSTIITILIGLFGILIYSFSISLFIIKPLNILTLATNEISKGKFIQNTKVMFKDEFGKLSDSFNKMVKHVNFTLFERDKEIAERKLAELKYQTIFKQSPDAIFIINPETLLPIEFNNKALELTGYEREEFLTIPISQYEGIEKINEIKTRAEIILREGSQEFESKLKRKNGDLIDVNISTQVINYLGIKVFHFIVRDISEIKENQRSLIETENRYRTFINSATESFVILDSDLNIVDFDDSGSKILNKKREDILGKNLADIVSDIKESGRYEKYMSVIKTGKPIVMEEVLMQKKYGSLIMRISAFKVNSGLGVIFTNITEKVKLEKKIMEVHENAQRKFGQDLHDVLGQDLAGLSLLINSLEIKLKNKNIDEVKDISDISEFIAVIHRRSRNIIWNYYPLKMIEEGLEPAIIELCQSTENIFNISCEIKIVPGFMVKKNDEIHVFRIIQEAISNAVKHSNCNLIRVSISLIKKKYYVKIIDDGIGFNVTASKNGLGLIIMKNRAKMFSSNLNVESKINSGTQITFKIFKWERKKDESAKSIDSR